jgi:hypothetical protein
MTNIVRTAIVALETHIVIGEQVIAGDKRIWRTQK